MKPFVLLFYLNVWISKTIYRKKEHLKEMKISNALIEQAQSGDGEALITLLECYKQEMFRIAYGILKNNMDAADAIQDTALSCYEKIGTLKEPAAFKYWMFKGDDIPFVASPVINGTEEAYSLLQPQKREDGSFVQLVRISMNTLSARPEDSGTYDSGIKEFMGHKTVRGTWKLAFQVNADNPE